MLKLPIIALQPERQGSAGGQPEELGRGTQKQGEYDRFGGRFCLLLDSRSEKLQGAGQSPAVLSSYPPGQPVFEEYHQLPHYYAPIPDGHIPFFTDLINRQINGFFETVVGRISCLGFSKFAEHPVEAFHCVCCINKPPNLLGILEIYRQLSPVFLPGFINLWVAFIPLLTEFLKLV